MLLRRQQRANYMQWLASLGYLLATGIVLKSSCLEKYKNKDEKEKLPLPGKTWIAFYLARRLVAIGGTFNPNGHG